MSKRTNRKVTMPTVCWKVIKDLLGQPGWATTPKIIVAAGSIEIELADLPKALTPATEKAWADKLVSKELSSRDQDAIEKCLQVHIEKGSLGANEYTKKLVDEFLDVS